MTDATLEVGHMLDLLDGGIGVTAADGETSVSKPGSNQCACGGTFVESKCLLTCSACGAVNESCMYLGGDMAERGVACKQDILTDSGSVTCIGTKSRCLGMDSRDRALVSAMRRIQCAASAGNICSAVLKAAEHTYVKVTDAPMMRGTRRDGIAEGSLYVASKTCHAPRTVGEIAKLFGVADMDVTRGARRVSEVLATYRNKGTDDNNTTSPQDYLPRFLASVPKTEQSRDVAAASRTYLDMLQPTLRDEAAAVVAALALVMAWDHLGLRGSITIVYDASGVPRGTLRRCLKCVMKHDVGIHKRAEDKLAKM